MFVFFGKFGVLCFPETPVLRFGFLSYYRKIYSIKYFCDAGAVRKLRTQ